MSGSAALLLGLVSCCAAAGEQPVPPHNVRMVTLNTQYSLSWDYGSAGGDDRSATFTTQYLPKYKLKLKKTSAAWNTACSQTPQWSCDLTAFNLHYLGIYVIRVRARVNDSHSDWVEKEFCPDKDAAVGPPAVRLVPVGSSLEVVLTDPLATNNSSMRHHLPSLYYHIRYWENSEEASVSMLSSSASVVTLPPPLKAFTWYCVSVQSRYDFYQKSSNFTAAHCEQTKGALPWWQSFMFFLGSLMIGFLLVLLLLLGIFFIRKTFMATLFPDSRLPPHFLQFSQNSPGSDIPALVTVGSEALLYDGVLLVQECELWEQNVPSDEGVAERPSDSSCQASSSSGDSGVFSTGPSAGDLSGASGGRSGTSDLCGTSVDLEQVKMRQLKSGASFADNVVAVWM